MRSRILQLLPIIFPGMLPVSAPAAATAEAPVELDPLRVITASRYEQPAGEALASISVITRYDIERSGAQDLFELLRLQPGLDVVRTGGAGAQTSVFMRGGNSSHTLVLIDGVRAASANTGAYAWEHLPLNLVERVEIVRGPRSALFGSEAIGGVIQVFTRVSDAPYARTTLGSDATRELETGAGFGLGPLSVSVSAGLRRADGFSSQNVRGYSFHPDNDGFESRNLGVSGTRKTRAGEWRFRLAAMDNEVEFDQGVSEFGQLLGSVSRDGRLRDGWEYRFRVGLVDEHLDSDFGFFATEFESRRLDLGWENRLRLANGTLAFGFDYQAETGASDSSYDRSRRNAALYALWDRTLGPARVQLSGRLDGNSVFGSEFTHQAGLRLDAGKSGALLALWATAFRAPTLNEQYSPGFGGLFAGNPALGPETSDSLEISYRADFGSAGRLAAAAYDSDVDRLIDFTGPAFGAVNIDRVRLRGLELDWSRAQGPWALGMNATFQHARNLSSGSDLLRRPARKGSLTARRSFDHGSWLGAEWFASGDRLDIGGLVLPGYSVLNLSGGYRVNDSLGLELRLDNLLDADYEPAFGFNGAGRSFFLSLAYNR